MTLYESLGIDKSATPEQIKAAYRKKARELHPDKNNGEGVAEFQEMKSAYEPLIKLLYYPHCSSVGGHDPVDTLFDFARSPVVRQSILGQPATGGHHFFCNQFIDVNQCSCCTHNLPLVV